MLNSSETSPRVIAAVTCDFEHAAIGTRSRLRETIGAGGGGGKSILAHVIERLLSVGGLSDIVLLVPPGQSTFAEPFATDPRIHIMELIPRSPAIDARIRIGRAWNLQGWRGGAGQFTCFDEEYHPAAIAQACVQLNADHILAVHSHSLFLDVEMTTALLHHHLHKNSEMRVTFTPSAPGLTGMFLRADIAVEMGKKSVMPWQLLAYDPQNPNFDTLIREACMQVDPALSKIPNRFCVDTDRSWQMAERLYGQQFASTAALALAAADTVASGVRDFTQIAPFPRELEIELTGERLTTPPGSVPSSIREARGTLDAVHWERWFAEQHFPDDLLLTFAGDGDAALFRELPRILKAARRANPLSICVQTDLASDSIDSLLAAIADNLLDVITIPLYGHTAATYNKVANAALHDTVTRNLQKLAAATLGNNGVPLVIPRLLKVRDTIPELEPFFDTWLQQSGWAVIEAPTDRAGSVSFEAVVDMAPPKRRPCRRLWDRVLVRANGTAVVCDQDIHDTLSVGHINSHTLPQLWNSTSLSQIRQQHADSRWNEINPCRSCREWHRP